MNIQESILSRKYATAFLNLFIDKLSLADYNTIVRTAAFLQEEPRLVSYFKLPRVDVVKKKVITVLFKEFKLPSILKKLTDLLMRDQRLFLLGQVLKSMEQLYRQRKEIMAFEVSSSYKLTEKQLETITDLLVTKTGKRIEYEYEVDNALIAGIRLQSDTLLWEYSIARQLAEAQRLLSS